MNKVRLIYFLLSWMLLHSCNAQSPEKRSTAKFGSGLSKPVVGAEQLDAYLPLCTGKGIAIVANPTSRCGNRHLVDTLAARGLNIRVVFAPEHGFRGEAEAGEHVSGGVDQATGVRVVSLYGNHKKPTVDDLKGCEVVLFDIQDVGARFYTYISTLELVMEACAEQGLTLIVLDRPNPNGHIVDGPVLDTVFRSFVGMQPVPVLHGMTTAEYARMLNGEGWLSKAKKCKLKVVEVTGWKHDDEYKLPVAPSPNLPNQASVRLYASLCLFEGTLVSLGRGTDWPFQCYGYPQNLQGDFMFTPVSVPGKAARPPQEGKLCRGERLDSLAMKERPEKLELQWLLRAWNACPDSLRGSFFTPFFEKLAGTAQLRRQIVEGWSEEKIRESWQYDLQAFLAIRKKYLLYP